MNATDLRGVIGSPVLNTQGEVVGVAYGRISNLLTFTKVSDIKKLLSGEESTLCSSSQLPVKCFEQEVKNLRQMSEEGSAFAQYILSGILLFVIEMDEELAFKWLKKSADQGYAVAEYSLGYFHWKGIGTERDKELAFKWLKKSADQGYALAEYSLGYVYLLKGIGTEIDEELALKWFKKSADQGFALAEEAYMYLERYWNRDR